MSDNYDESLYLGIDPGKCKTGLALVDGNGKIIKLRISTTANIYDEAMNFCQGVKIIAVILGDGTNSKNVAEKLQGVLPTLPQFFVGEAYSTEEARKIYWQENPPEGIKKLIPQGLLVPPIPLDAYAAVVQVRRWLKLKK